MKIGDRVHVRSKESVSPYDGTVTAVSGEHVNVRSQDGTERTHPAAHCDVVASAEPNTHTDVPSAITPATKKAKRTKKAKS